MGAVRGDIAIIFVYDIDAFTMEHWLKESCVWSLDFNMYRVQMFHTYRLYSQIKSLVNCILNSEMSIQFEKAISLLVYMYTTCVYAWNLRHRYLCTIHVTIYSMQALSNCLNMLFINSTSNETTKIMHMKYIYGWCINVRQM